ncbi:hypothetical protein EP331_08710 [bacterium]|nr:MAG: hypothetical protein EP331_08710 [bacterium]
MENKFIDQIEVVNVSRETFEEIDWYFNKYNAQFKEYARQINWWNAKFNLVSRNTNEAMLLEHIRHSLTPCITEDFWKAKLIVDGGTGSGLPGLPLSLIHDEVYVKLVDVNLKKITAVKQIIGSMGLSNIEAVCEPIESIKEDNKPLFVSKHAFKLDELFSKKHDTEYSSYLFLKGADYHEELNDDLIKRFSIKAFNLQTGTHLSFFNHKFLVQLTPQ